MKSISALIVSVLLCSVFSSCSKVVLNYGKPSPNSGNIVIKTTSSVSVNLTVNDSLLVNQRYARSITIKNVPEGVNSIHFSAYSQSLMNPMDSKLQVNVEKGKTNTQLLTVPPRSTGYWIYTTGSVITLWALLLIPW